MPGTETRLVRESAENLQESWWPDARPRAWIPLVGASFGADYQKAMPETTYIKTLTATLLDPGQYTPWKKPKLLHS